MEGKGTLVRLFVLGFAIPWVVLTTLTSLWAWPFASAHAMNGTMIVVKLFGVPVGAAWLAYELVQAVRPSRAFDPRRRRYVSRIVRGVAVGLLAVGAVIVAFAANAPGERDVLIVGLASAGSVLLSLLCMRRVRKDRCVICDYSTLGLSGPRCPECGTFFD